MQPIIGRRPVLQNCGLGELEIDAQYQRSIDTAASQSLIRTIARAWDWRLCHPLVVSRRLDQGGERFFVVDGQHRLAAARLRADISDLPCVVVDYQDAADEAAGFVALNRQRRPLTAIELFRSEIAAGNPEATDILSMLADAGLALAPHTNYASWKPGVLGNVSGLRRAYRSHGRDLCARSLKVLARAFQGQVLRFGGTIFPGIAHALASAPSALERADHLLIMILSDDTQQGWARAIGGLAAEQAIHQTRASEICLTEALQECAAEVMDEAA